MAEYVEREALLWFLDARKRDTCNGAVSCLQMQRMVERIPAADVAPVRHGRWTKSEDDWNSLTTITCSECHEEWCFETEEDVSLLNYRYCPNCGAKMGGADHAE